MDANTNLTNNEAGLNQSLNLLLIDDDDICIFIHRKIAEKSGVFRKIRTARNGKNGIEILKKTEETIEVPNIILLDLNMPVMNGLDFLETFQNLDFKNKEQISIVIVTSSITKNDKLYAASLGVSYYLTKPLTRGAFNSVIVHLIKPAAP